MTDITENDFWNALNEPEPVIITNGCGEKKYRWYNEKDELHRENDLPALITYFHSFKISETWYYNSIKHRNNNLPAVITYYADSNIIANEIHYVYGALHNDKGPSIIGYDRYGKIYHEEYYYSNNRYSKDEFINLVTNIKNNF